MLLDTKISRRGFLQTAGALTFSFTFVGRASNALAQGEAARFNAWVSIGADDIVTVMIPSAEMGQGGIRVNMVPRDGGNSFRGGESSDLWRAGSLVPKRQDGRR